MAYWQTDNNTHTPPEAQRSWEMPAEYCRTSPRSHRSTKTTGIPRETSRDIQKSHFNGESNKNTHIWSEEDAVVLIGYTASNSGMNGEKKR